jgi:hypothetical protein
LVSDALLKIISVELETAHYVATYKYCYQC